MATTRAIWRYGINAYPGAPLRGCINDLNNFWQTTVDLVGRPAISQTFADRKATQIAMRQGLQDIVKASADLLIWQYSGHGAFVADTSGDEAQWGGQDQVIVPVDYQQKGFILDDEFGSFASRVAQAGKRAVVILDSCYSGWSSFSLLAGAARKLTRTPTNKALPEDCITPQARDAVAFDQEHLPLTSRDTWTRTATADPCVWLTDEPVIFIEMARHNETAADAYINGKYNGAGTYALCAAWRKLAKSGSYIDVVTEANNWLQNNGYAQRINLEGDFEHLQKPFLF